MADAPLTVMKAAHYENPPGTNLVNLTFSDGTHFSIYPDSPEESRIYAHDLYDNFLAAGGKLE